MVDWTMVGEGARASAAEPDRVGVVGGPPAYDRAEVGGEGFDDSPSVGYRGGDWADDGSRVLKETW